MKKRLLALLLVFAMLLPVFNVTAFANDGTSTPEKQYSVTVYFSLTDDGSILNGLGLKKMTVPYFDLANYGLDQFYFSREDYNQYPGWSEIDPSHPKSDLTPGTKEFAKGFVTMLHLFIYALEAYKYHYTPDQIGTGALLKDPEFNKAEDLNVSGSVGSMFLNNYWGMDYNLNYYKNYEYPLASEGWGATADQILLHDGDVVTMGHFSGYYFYNDPNSIFGYAQPTALGETSVLAETTAAYGDTIDMTLYHAGPDNTGNYTTAHTPITENTEPITVYYCDADNVPAGGVGNDGAWSPLTVADGNGNFQIDTTELGRGTFFVAMPGLPGVEYSDYICCTPGGIRLVVQ